MPGANRRWIIILILLLALAGCAAPAAEDAEESRGGASPEQVVESFIEALNLALQDPALSDASVRRSWAERLASYFAPSERADQRQAMREMLNNFVSSAQRPFVGQRVSLTISFTGIELISRGETEALVRVVDGTITLRWLNGEGDVLRERTAGLTEVIGQTSGGLPVILVGGQWFITEG